MRYWPNNRNDYHIGNVWIDSRYLDGKHHFDIMHRVYFRGGGWRNADSYMYLRPVAGEAGKFEIMLKNAESYRYPKGLNYLAVDVYENQGPKVANNWSGAMVTWWCIPTRGASESAQGPLATSAAQAGPTTHDPRENVAIAEMSARDRFFAALGRQDGFNAAFPSTTNAQTGGPDPSLTDRFFMEMAKQHPAQMS